MILSAALCIATPFLIISAFIIGYNKALRDAARNKTDRLSVSFPAAMPKIKPETETEEARKKRIAQENIYKYAEGKPMQEIK